MHAAQSRTLRCRTEKPSGLQGTARGLSQGPGAPPHRDAGRNTTNTTNTTNRCGHARCTGAAGLGPARTRGLRTGPPKSPWESREERLRRGGRLPPRRPSATHPDAGSSHGHRCCHSRPADAKVHIKGRGLPATAALGPQTNTGRTSTTLRHATPRPQRK